MTDSDPRVEAAARAIARLNAPDDEWQGWIREAKAALEAADRAAWRPIEEAPRDGRPLLVWGLWAGEIHGVGRDPTIDIAAYRGPGGDFEGFDWVCQTGDAYACWMQPTHFCELTAPPTSEDSEQEVEPRPEDAIADLDEPDWKD